MYNSGFLIIDISPAHNETNVPTNASIKVSFMRDMIEDTITSSTFSLSKVNGAVIPSKVSYVRTTKSALITPLAPLESGTQYRLSISGGEKGISTVTGGKLPSHKYYEFTTTQGSVVGAPAGINVSLVDGYPTITWLPSDTYNPSHPVEYKVHISTSMIEPDVENSSIIWPLASDAVGAITGTTLNVSKRLVDGTYYVYIKAFNGAHSSSWSSYQLLVDSEVIPTVPPSTDEDTGYGSLSMGVFEVHDTYPQKDAVHITPDNIQILFTDAVDFTTVTPSTVYILKGRVVKPPTIINFMTDLSPSKSIPFTINTPSMDNLISITLNPEDVEVNTDYTVVIRESVTAKSGEKLGEAHVYSFMSTLVPLFGDAERVRDDIGKFIRNVPDRTLYKYLQDASYVALDIASRINSRFNEETYLANVPRHAHEFARFQAGYDIVLNAIVQETQGIGTLRTLGDLTIQPNQNIGQVNEIIANLKRRIKPWLDELYGHHGRGYAKPAAVVKGETGAVYPDFLARAELEDPSEG